MRIRKFANDDLTYFVIDSLSRMTAVGLVRRNALCNAKAREDKSGKVAVRRLVANMYFKSELMVMLSGMASTASYVGSPPRLA